MGKLRGTEPTQEQLRKVFDYTPETGVFHWKLPISNRVKVGQPAGSVHKYKGYLTISYDKRKYRAHRLAWIYMNGNIPDGLFIDHINMVTSDNRIANLRLCTNSENLRNVGMRKSNTSGVKGVSWSKEKCKWEVRLMVNNKQIFIGYFIDKELAMKAYRNFCENNHGEFYRDTSK